MAHQPSRALLSILGTVAWGDLGPLTMYRSKRKKLVAFAKTWPTGDPSPEQTKLRDAFRAAAIAWQALTDAARAQWELATKRASLCMHGYDLWVHWRLIGDDHAIEALERITGTTLLPP